MFTNFQVINKIRRVIPEVTLKLSILNVDTRKQESRIQERFVN